MTFRRIAGELRMVSDEDKKELFLLFTGPEGVSHFRIVNPDCQFEFEAVLVLNSVPEWQVERIFEITTPNIGSIAKNSNESVRAVNSTDLSLIVQALIDFGHFFGEKAGEVKVSLKTNTIYRKFI